MTGAVTDSVMIAGLVAKQIAADRGRRLVISRARRADPRFAALSAQNCTRWVCALQTLEDLPPIERYQVGFVFDQLAHMKQSDAVELLARLRDGYCDRVIVVESASPLSITEMRALGYVRLEKVDGGAPVYLYDPAIDNQEREWNNARDWANPENFDRYRW